MTALVIARHSLAELRSRRLVPTIAVLSVAFVALFAAGFSALYSRAEAAAGADPELLVVAGAIMTVLGLYAVHFVTAFLAMFVAVGAVSSPLASGTLHAVLARPISRASWLAGRWSSLVLLVVVYPALMAAALLAVARLVAGYGPVGPLRAAGLLALEGIVPVLENCAPQFIPRSSPPCYIALQLRVFREMYRPVKCHPDHQLGIDVVPWAVPLLPDSIIFFSPGLARHICDRR